MTAIVLVDVGLGLYRTPAQ